MFNRYQIIKKECDTEADCGIFFAESEADALEKFRLSLQKSGIHAKYGLLHKDVLEISNGRATFKAVRLKKFVIRDDVRPHIFPSLTVFAKDELSALTTYMNTLDAPVGGETGIIGISDIFPDGRPRLIMGYGSQFIATPIDEEADKTEGKTLGPILE